MTQFNSINKFGTDMFDEDIDEALDDLESGGSGTVDYGGKIISNVGNPLLDNDVATKVYVDVNDSLRLTRSVGAAQALTGDLYLGNHKIKEVQTPTDDNDAVNINYFNARMGNFCAKSGFTMTGEIQMSENILYLNPTSYLHADSVGLKINSNDTYFTNGTTNIMNILSDKVVLLQELDANNKNIINLPTPTLPTHPVNLGYLDSNYCKRSGFSMVGAIEMGGNVLRFAGGNIAHINDTLYIDSNEIAFSRGRTNILLLNGAGINPNSSINMGTNRINFTNGALYSRNGYMVIKGGASTEDIILSNVISFYKSLNVNNQVIYGVPSPINDNHAVNKGYVDNKYGTPEKYKSITCNYLGVAAFTVGVNIEPGISPGEFLQLPTGQFGCYSTYIPGALRGSIPIDTKGYLRVIRYQDAPINRFYEWINASNGDRWVARVVEAAFVNWRKINSLELSETNSIQHDLDMAGFQITNLASPSSGTSGANKDYVDSAVSGKLNKAGDVMTGNLIMSGYFINDIHDPIFDGDAVNKGYAISLNNLKVSKSGDTMTGALNMNNNYIRNLPTPTLSSDAATMGYVDTVGNTKVSNTGDTMSGALNMNGYNITGLPVTFAGINGNSSALSYGLFFSTLVDFSNTVVQKVGDTMTGNLLMSSETTNIISLGCQDLSGTKGFNILLGSSTEQIQCQLNQPVSVFTNNGLLVKDNNTDVIRLGTSNTDARINVYQDIMMNQKYIANLHDPQSQQDAATKNYVDNRLIRNTSQMIPYLISNNANKNGIVISASSFYNNQYKPWRVWSYSVAGAGGEWSTAAGLTTNEWLMIQFPYAARIWRVDILGRSTSITYFNDWRIEGSNDGVNFTTLYSSTVLLDYTYKIFEFDSLVKYYYYRFFGVSCNNTSQTPGFAFLNLYQLDFLK